MKTSPMHHQSTALKLMDGRDYFALFMEQGTGKTWTILADVERLYAAGRVDALFVLAPKGVHTNWVRREIPTHMEGAIVARAWRSGAGKRERSKLDELLRPRQHGETVPLRVLSMNIDALNTASGWDFALTFLRATRAMIALDESHTIKNPTSTRTQRVLALRRHAAVVRIATGTPITNSPPDVFAQFEFMESGLLGTTSYRAFVAEYAELMSNDHPLMKDIIKRNPRAVHAQLVVKNPDGSPRWRNLDKLRALITPHSFRVLKRDCLDLPAKVYSNHYFDLPPAQAKAYQLMQAEQRIEIVEGELVPVSKLAAIVKLQQITSGFVNLNAEPMYIAEGNARLAALMELLELVDGKFIVWARFTEEIMQIAAALRAAGIETVEYHGSVKDKDREAAVDGLQNGTVRAFVGQAQSGGVGLTLHAARTVIYFSNDFNLGTRKQSEDRAHRIGTKTEVLYIDLIANDTIDEDIARVLQRKAGMAETVLGDTPDPDQRKSIPQTKKGKRS